MTDRHGPAWHDVAWSAAGLAACASLWWPWAARRTGSTRPAHESADLVLSGVLDDWVPRWTGAAWYLVAAAGAVVIAASALSPGAARRCRMMATLVMVLATAVLVAALRATDSGPLLRAAGAGTWLALVATLACATLVAIGRRDTTTARSPRARPPRNEP